MQGIPVDSNSMVPGQAKKLSRLGNYDAPAQLAHLESVFQERLAGEQEQNQKLQDAIISISSAASEDAAALRRQMADRVGGEDGNVIPRESLVAKSGCRRTQSSWPCAVRSDPSFCRSRECCWTTCAL
eukprot:scaffold731_cov261-Pinguiococcus_pyrenoidosus.AAC.10